MTMKPRVHAHHETDANELGTMSGIAHTTPGIHIEVTFDLHDHHAALALFEAAIAETKMQIEETQ